MEQLTDTVNLKPEKDSNSELGLPSDVDAVEELYKPLNSFDYFTRCQDNLKHAIYLSAIIKLF